ncbi:retrovirus-related Pol polyprotein from transposon 412 [Trichonephila clavipes]|nr:retrovirus-related Pol polyprotein from transposon 412 [Trichonephila clavipes]
MSASTGTMCGVTWKCVVTYVIPVLHAKVPENALEEDCSCIMWELLSNEYLLDILGPLPRSSDDNNNVLVVMDYFTKWPEAYPISDQEASTFAEVPVQHWFSRFGVPLQLHSDQGETLILQFARDCGKYSPLTKSGQQLYILSLTAWSVVQKTTGYSPSQMLFGHDLHLPGDLLFSRPPDAPLAPEEYIEKLQARMEEMHHLARERIGMASEKMKTRYDAKDSLQSSRPTGKVLTQS